MVGAGLVGLATAHALIQHRCRVLVIDKEPRVAAHQSSHNSGVIHSGLYYKPGSARARLCVEGRRRMVEFCRTHGIAHDVCGKLVVASEDVELPRLDVLRGRGVENGLAVRVLTPAEMRDYEPAVTGVGALHVPEAGIADYPGVAAALQREIVRGGGVVALDTALVDAQERSAEVRVRTTGGELRVGALVACAGLHADRVAAACGVATDVVIAPFRGEYYRLRPERAGLVRHLVYPVPDPRFPFLGVHFTRMALGGVEAGPNAVLALSREGYDWATVSARDVVSAFASRGLRRFMARHLSTGVAEVARSLSRARFAASLARLVPGVTVDDLEPGGSGVRAMALLPDGSLVDDFHFVDTPRMVHVLNAPSPAATASLAIGDEVATRVIRAMGGAAPAAVAAS